MTTADPGRGLLPAGWDRYRDVPYPHLQASCARHGGAFAVCDHCASVPAMAVWANGLSEDELREALIIMVFEALYYTDAERRALLFEAARRITCPS